MSTDCSRLICLSWSYSSHLTPVFCCILRKEVQRSCTLYLIWYFQPPPWQGRKKSFHKKFLFQEIVKESFFNSMVSGSTRISKSRHRKRNEERATGPVLTSVKEEKHNILHITHSVSLRRGKLKTNTFQNTPDVFWKFAPLLEATRNVLWYVLPRWIGCLYS